MGFSLKYSGGYECKLKGNKFSTVVAFMCDKQFNIGCPSVQSKNFSVWIDGKPASPALFTRISSRSSCSHRIYKVSHIKGPN
jgi:hypothetical protein